MRFKTIELWKPKVSPEELNPDEFTRFQKFIYTMSGIRVPETKRSLLSSRIRRRLKGTEFDGYRAYLQHLKSPRGTDEIPRFLDEVTTNETFFFRTEKHFEWFSTQFLSGVVRDANQGLQSKSLRIWSAACSTGEEPYSLAICLAENQLRLRDWDLKIIGTDISPNALRQARQGIYKSRAVEGVNDKRRRRYFTRQGEDPTWQVRPGIQEMVEFKQHNLMEPLRGKPFDCIFVRNVLIYFDRESKKKVVANLINSMANNSWLVVGPSEGVYGMLDGLTKHTPFLYRKEL